MYSSEKVKEDYYFLNCYRRLTRSKTIHVFFLLFEFLLILFQEIDTFQRGFKPRYKTEGKIILSPIILLIQELDNCPEYTKFIIIIVTILIFDSIYIFLCRKNIKNNSILLYIIVNFLELFYFRLYTIFFYSLLFALTKQYFIFAFLLSLYDAYLRIFNFLHNHLYFYVPKFVEYPYDEFSSRYDLYLILSKLVISISGTAINAETGIFCFFTQFILQIYYCYYFMNKLFFHSYLFMNNSFLNITKLSFFFGKTTILILTYLIREKNLFTILYFVICFDIILIIFGLLYFIYDPFSHIYINSQTPLKNILFYLNIINKRKDIEFLVENQIINHFKECGLCDLCQKYIKYKKEQIENIKDNNNENEKDSLIINKNNKIIELFNILYDQKQKYFEFIFRLIINYKKYGKNNLIYNTNYYINLSNLIYFDTKNKNIVLSLNEKIILELINEENKSFLENHQIQIKQLLLYNEYFGLVKKILNILNEILNSANNFAKIEKLIILSKLLKEMKNENFKNYLFNRKFKYITNSKNLLLACAIFYEEIFNKIIGKNKIQIRENNQLLEDFSENSNKNENSKITLRFNLLDYNLYIIRVGKELFSYLNNNLYELFPIVLKNYQIEIFRNLIFNGFNDKHENIEEMNDDKNIFIKKKKLKNEFITTKLIIFEKISNKTFYKLLNIKLTCLFNNEYNNYILFNGNYFFNKNTIVSVIDINHKKEIDEKVVGYSNLWVEKLLKKNLFSIKNYNLHSINYGHKLTKLFSYQISVKLYNIYNIETKNTIVMKRRSTIGDVNKFVKITKNKNKEKYDDEEESSKGTKKNKIYEEINTINKTNDPNKSKGIFVIDKKKINSYNDIDSYFIKLNNIRKIIYISIILIIFIMIIEYCYFYKFQKQEYNCDISYRNFKSFFRLYNQLLTSILSVVCIPEKIDSNKCRNYISIFNNKYSISNPDENFNFTKYILAQNKILAQRLMEEKASILKIREYLGTKQYNRLFYGQMKYVQITKGNNFNVSEVTLRFFDIILIMCNSFLVITENSTNALTQPIYFLNKSENPFVNLYNQNEMSTYQEEVYNIILNYKYFSNQIQITNVQIINNINDNKIIIKGIIFFILHFTIFLFLIISFLIYCYIIYFNKTISKVLNDVINVMNIKDEGFDFSEKFTKKLENLELIIELYRISPLIAIKNLNSIYNDYNTYLNKKSQIIKEKKSNIYINVFKKEKEIKDIEIQQFQNIVSRKEINKLEINNKYICFFIINLILTIIIYILFLFIWIKFFLIKVKLNNVFEKNSRLEKNCYDAINMYELMIFNNYTINEMIKFMKIQNQNDEHIYKNNSNIIFNNFYQTLYLFFDSKKDKNKLDNIYNSFEQLYEFNCENIYNIVKIDMLEELYKLFPHIDIKQKLINICIISHITESKDIKTIFERHFQFIKNGMLTLNDFSYEGLNKNLNTTYIGRITFFFLTVTIYIIEIIAIRPYNDSIKNLNDKLNQNFLLMEIFFFIFAIYLILIITFFYFNKINKFCKQIFLLRKTFNIFKT